MFQLGGATIRKLDAGGRAGLTDALRDVYSKNLVIAPGFDNCIRAYSKKSWDAFAVQLSLLDQNDPDVADFVRFFAAMTSDVEVDSNGRIKFTEALLKWAGFSDELREIEFYDAGDYIEFWEVGRFNQYMTDKAPTFKELARKLFGKQTDSGAEGSRNGAGSPAGNGG